MRSKLRETVVDPGGLRCLAGPGVQPCRVFRASAGGRYHHRLKMVHHAHVPADQFAGEPPVGSVEAAVSSDAANRRRSANCS